GLAYCAGFLSEAEEYELLQRIRHFRLAPFQMKGVVSKRLVLHFGWDYDYDAWQIKPAAPLPDFLVALRGRAAAEVGEDSALYEEALINGYPPGAGIGWHRDAPMFGSPVLGISLGDPAMLRLRRKTGEGFETYKQPLEPRSL